MPTLAATPPDATRTRLLLADVAMSAPAAAILLVGAPWLDGVLGIPTWGIAAIGAFFAVYVATLLLFVRAGAPRWALGAVAAGNTGWGVLSIAVVAADALTLTAAGTVAALAQAAAVIVIAVPQARAARR